MDYFSFELTESMVAIGVSLLSLVISIIAGYVSYKQNKKLNNVNMKAKYYNSIFDEYLITKIPQARKYLRFQDEQLVDSEKLSLVLSEMLNDALFFKYDNEDFYCILKMNIQRIEDYVLECGNIRIKQKEQVVVFNKIQVMLSDLYKCINDSYIGN